MATIMKKPTPAPGPGEPGAAPRGVLGALDAIYRFLASLKLAVISLTGLAAFLAYATFYESWYGTAAVQERVYNHVGFHLLLLLLATNILCAALIRFPWTKRQTGFVITHAGLLTLIAGSWWTLKSADEGMVGMLEGQTSRQLVRTNFPVIRVRPVDPHTGAASREYEVPFRPGPFDWKPGRFEVLTSPRDAFQLAVKAFHPASAPKVVVVPDPAGVPSLKLRPRFQPPGSAQAMDVFDDEESWFRTDRRLYRATRARGANGPMPAAFSFQYVDRPEMVEDFLNPPTDLGPTGAARLRYTDNAGKARVYDWPIDESATEPKTITLPDSDLEATQLKPIEMAASQVGLTPQVGDVVIHVAHFSIRKAGGPPITHYAWGMLPMMANTIPNPREAGAEAPTPLAAISYYLPPEFDAGRMRLGAVEVIATPEKRLYYRVFGRGDKEGTAAIRASGPLELGKEVVAFGGDKMPMQITFSAREYLPAGVQKVVAEPIQLPKGQMGSGIPAALIELTVDGQTQETWIRMGGDQLEAVFNPVDFPNGQRYEVALDVDRKDLGFEIALDDFDVGFDPGTDQASSFVSKVRVTDPEQKVKDKPVTISMNEPMVHRKWTFYQSSYIRARDGRGRETGQFKSVFQVGSDPGRAVKYLGSLMICVGAFVQFYMKAGVFTGMSKARAAKRRGPDEAEESL